jgi:hypothetical protein
MSSSTADSTIAGALALLRQTFGPTGERAAIIQEIQRGLPEGDYAWLDVGIGDGLSSSRLLNSLESLGRRFVVTGIDPELQSTCYVCEARPDTILEKVRAEDYVPSNKFHVINMRQSGYYISQLPDVIATLSGCLARNGLIVVTHWATECVLFGLHRAIAATVGSLTVAESAEELHACLTERCAHLTTHLSLFPDRDFDPRRIAEDAELSRALFRLCARRLPVDHMSEVDRLKLTQDYLHTCSGMAYRCNGVLFLSHRPAE